MKVQIIKREIPTEISEAGGASVLIVNKETTDLETSIEESKDALIVVGDKLLVKGMFVGLFKSMITGIERDGNARSLGDFLTLYPVPTGEFDLEKGWDPAANGVRIRARLLNEMEIDISKWEFEDVTPGRQSFRLESVKAGDVTGVVVLGQAIEINGKPLPLTDEIRVDWAVRDTVKSGTIPATKVTSTVSRADIASDALDEIKSATYDGKTLDLTVRGNYANAKISAMLKYVAPVLPKIKIGAFTAQMTEVDCELRLTGLENIAGAKEYSGSSFRADIYKNGTLLANDTFNLPSDTEAVITRTDIAEGDTVKVVIDVDPSKAAEYDPTPAEATTTVLPME